MLTGLWDILAQGDKTQLNTVGMQLSVCVSLDNSDLIISNNEKT